MFRWRRIESKVVIHDKWLHVTADHCEVAPGKVIQPYYVAHEKEWVHVLAIDDHSQVLTVRQYRYAGEAFCIELPGGVVDAGELPITAAKRELLEETGHSAKQWSYVGKLFANPARQTNSIHIFIAQQTERMAVQSLDDSEEITYQHMSHDAIQEAIQSGEFSQALHVASYFMALTFLRAPRDA